MGVCCQRKQQPQKRLPAINRFSIQGETSPFFFDKRNISALRHSQKGKKKERPPGWEGAFLSFSDSPLLRSKERFPLLCGGLAIDLFCLCEKQLPETVILFRAESNAEQVVARLALVDDEQGDLPGLGKPADAFVISSMPPIPRPAFYRGFLLLLQKGAF